MARLVFGGHNPQNCDGCPTTLLIAAVDSPRIAASLEAALLVLGAFVAVLALAVLLRRWHGASADGIGYLLKDRVSDLEELAEGIRRVGGAARCSIRPSSPSW